MLHMPVNVGTMSKLVKDAYGVDGNDLAIGADILCRAALSDEFANASGRYFDNDSGLFKDPHNDALDPTKNRKLVEVIERLLQEKLSAAPPLIPADTEHYAYLIKTWLNC